MVGHHGCRLAPSPWIERFAGIVPAGPVLDLACGAGRHARLFLERGHAVTALDIDLSGVSDLIGRPGFEAIATDLEADDAWPLGSRRFAGVVVANYLHRPLFPAILGSLAKGGLLIYETFAEGNERYGKPRNPDHLLKHGELIELARGRLRVLAYEDLEVTDPWPACVQRIAAANSR